MGRINDTRQITMCHKWLGHACCIGGIARSIRLNIVPVRFKWHQAVPGAVRQFIPAKTVEPANGILFRNNVLAN